MVEEMTVHKGFQKTEAGIIPTDWLVKTLQQVAYFENGKAHEQFIDGFGEFVVVNSKFISTEGRVRKFSKRNICPLEKGDIAIVMSDIPNGKALAKCFFVDADNQYTLNQRIGKIISNEETDNRYLFYKLDRNVYYLAHDSGTGQTNLKRQEVLDCPIPLPPTKAEQTSIATALGDMDALIEAQEKLLVKKRLIKQGAMQELLRPKEGWEEKKLGQVATLKARIGWQGLTTAEYKKSGDYFLITGTDFRNGLIDWDNCHYVEYERYAQDKNIQVKEHDVLVTKDGTIGKVAFIRSVPKPATLNSGVFVIRPKEKSFYPEFFYYLLLSEVFSNFLSQLSAGSTINHLYQKDFVHFRFEVPKTIEEQEKIAQIFADMDREIEQLEVQLKKYKLLKTGMMQDLLTGRKRLVQYAPMESKTSISNEKPKKKKHNWQINEAVVIGVLASEFGSETYPIGRKRYTKLSYLLHRYAEKKAEGYLKKAAGPYNPATRYKGPEKIALYNGYVREIHNGKYHGLAAGDNISQAQDYFAKWYGSDALEWLRQYRFEKNDTLELWATVDMAIEDLKEAGQQVTWHAVKQLIENTEEWRPKLKRSVFSDENIQEAMLKIDEILQVYSTD